MFSFLFYQVERFYHSMCISRCNPALEFAVRHCDYLARNSTTEVRGDVSLFYCRMVDDLSGEQRDNETRAARINNGNLTSVTRYLSFVQPSKSAAN